MLDQWRAASRLAGGALLLTALLLVLHTHASDPTAGSVLVVAAQTMAGTVQECRKLSDAELAALPQHMRRAETCESRAVAYVLEARVDGSPRLRRRYSPAGIHGDRPITIAERLGIEPGRHDVALRLAPEEESGTAALPVFVFDEPVEFAVGRIRVVSLDSGTNGFALR